MPLSKIKAGKGFALALFAVYLLVSSSRICYAQSAGVSFPVIDRLVPTDVGFRQFISDVHANRRRLTGARPRPMEAAEHLTIFQYTVRQGEDIFFLAARSNVPYSAIASLNRINHPSEIEAGRLILLPSCPGIFIPAYSESDLERLITATRQNNENAIELRISVHGRAQTFLFLPGADFTPNERAFFLHSGFRFPLRNFRVTSPFGYREDPFTGQIAMHRGIDLAAPAGTEVFAAAEGIVTAIGNHPVYGIYIIITHRNNWTSLYGHLQSVETVLRAEVNSSTLIGRVGSTGLSTGPHLHFELRQGGRPIDPSGRLRL